MTNNIAKIRAALEWGEDSVFIEALAALAELERAAAQPVAWMWNDELGIPHVLAGQKKPVWVEKGLSSHMAKIVNLRPLYAVPPVPVAKIREPTDDECRNIWREAKANEGDGSKVCAGRAMFDAVKGVLWPKEGL